MNCRSARAEVLWQQATAVDNTSSVAGQVSPIVTLHTGFPLALYNNGPDPTGTASRGLRPDCNGTNTVYGRRDATAAQGGGFLWFDPATTPIAAGFGTVHRKSADCADPGSTTGTQRA